MKIILPLIGAVALSSCVGAPEPVPPARPVPIPTPTRAAPATPAPLAADWRDWPLTVGEWTYRQDARGSIALFGRAGADADVTLRCDTGERAVYLSRRGTTAGTGAIRTTSLTRSLAWQPVGGGTPYVAVRLAPNDALLDAIGFSRGRFVLDGAGASPLVIPAYAEVLRVTEDCR